MVKLENIHKTYLMMATPFMCPKDNGRKKYYLNLAPDVVVRRFMQ